MSVGTALNPPLLDPTTSGYMNNGIFDSGDYVYRVYDSWSPLMEDDAGIYIQTRTWIIHME